MTVVRNVLTDAAGAPLVDKLVSIELVALPGYVTGDDETVVMSTTVRTDTDGVWEVDLTPNADITPGGTVYRVSERSVRHVISVPESGATLWLGDLLSELPGELESGALANHSADTTGVHGIADTSALETAVGAQAKVDAHQADTTDVHGIADTGVLEAHPGDATNPHAVTALQAGAAASPHGLAGADHGAGTLAALNGLVSDATLDDAGDARTPDDHGNEAHTPDFAADADLTGHVGGTTGVHGVTADVDGSTTVGHEAGLNDTSGSLTAIGSGAGKANTTGVSNTATGVQALRENTTGVSNTATGLHALLANTTGVNNTATGVNVLRANTTGNNNTATGVQALYAPAGVTANATTTALRQTAVGYQTGQASPTQRDDIVAIGYRALVDADDTVALGSGAQALHANTVALGKGVVSTAASQVAHGATHTEMTEVAAPGNGGATSVRLYAEDDGAGKTRLMAVFGSGAPVQVAIEP